MKSKPAGGMRRNAIWGEFIGTKINIIRFHCALIYELLDLISVNKRLLDHPSFKEIIRLLNKNARESWEMLVEAASTGSVPKKSNPLYMIRNKIAFHYDSKGLIFGYKEGFLKENEILENACVSEGDTMESSRFCFVDLAIKKYLDKRIEDDSENFFSSLNEIMRNINMSLFHIVIKFIQGRGFAWKIPRNSAQI